MRASASGCWPVKGSTTELNMPESFDEAVALAKKHWVILTVAAVIVLVFAVSPFFLTLLVALVVAWFVVKYVKKQGGPEAAAAKVSEELKRHL